MVKNKQTIGIGAGPLCDAQIQVFHDVVGLLGSAVPKHANVYVDTKNIIKKALKKYQQDVLNNNFPDNAHSTKMNKTELDKFKRSIEDI